MAFCANCGAALNEGSGFCGSCGKPVAAAAPTLVTSAPGPSQAVAGSGLATNMAAALAYILGFISGIIFLVLEPYKNDRFVRFHAMQSIFFSFACIVFSIAWAIVMGMLISFSATLMFVTIPLRMLISLGMFVFWLFVMYQAYSQREYHIPFIGAMAAKQAGTGTVA